MLQRGDGVAGGRTRSVHQTEDPQETVGALDDHDRPPLCLQLVQGGCDRRVDAATFTEEGGVADEDLVALEGHHGSEPGEQDWLVVAFFLLVASYLGGLISLETGAAAALTFGLAFGLGRAQGLRDAAAASKGADAALPVPKARRRAAWRRGARARPGGMRRVRSASSLIN